MWVRLWTRIAGVYLQPRDYNYSTGNQCADPDQRSRIVSPTPGTVINSTSAIFNWTAGPAGTTQYWLDVGTTLGSGNISSGATGAQSRTVSGLPNEGKPLYVRIWTAINGVWQPPVDYVF